MSARNKTWHENYHYQHIKICYLLVQKSSSNNMPTVKSRKFICHILVKLYNVRKLNHWNSFAIHALQLTDFFYPHSRVETLVFVIFSFGLTLIMISLMCTALGFCFVTNHSMTSQSPITLDHISCHKSCDRTYMHVSIQVWPDFYRIQIIRPVVFKFNLKK